MPGLILVGAGVSVDVVFCRLEIAAGLEVDCKRSTWTSDSRARRVISSVDRSGGGSASV